MVMFQRFRALKSKGFLGSNQSNQSFPVRAWKENEKMENIFHNFKQKESLPPLLHQVYEYRILKKNAKHFPSSKLIIQSWAVSRDLIKAYLLCEPKPYRVWLLVA